MIRQLVFLIELAAVLFTVAQGVKFLVKALKFLIALEAINTSLYFFRSFLWLALSVLLAYLFENILK